MEIQYSNKQARGVPKKHSDIKPQMMLKENVSVVLKDFCARTSMHGLGEVAAHTVVIAKYVWFFRRPFSSMWYWIPSFYIGRALSGSTHTGGNDDTEHTNTIPRYHSV